VIDLRDLRGVTVDPGTRTAQVQPGATWADVDAATARHGLATTGGLISTTGVAGLTLGGGIGWLQRRYGLACDNLRAADLVTASGETLTAPDDLLRGLRGGGGNFGVVTRFEFDLHPVSTVLGGLMVFPLARGREVLQAFREWAADAPDDMTMLAAVLTAPPEPFVPADLVGQKVLGLVGCCCGDLDAGTAALGPLRDLGPAADVFGPMPYPALQQMLDGSAPPGRRNSFRGGFAADLTDAVIDAVLEHGARMPSRFSQIHLHQMGGQVGRLGPDASAFSGRAAGYTFNLVSSWIDPAEDETHLAANRAAAAALAPHAMTASYVNFISTGFDADTAYGTDIFLRLARLKREYDPANVFHRNQNIRPAA
jgi:FAD/FMN-containing dehydrogenase